MLTCEAQTVHHYCRTQVHSRSLAEGCRCKLHRARLEKKGASLLLPQTAPRSMLLALRVHSRAPSFFSFFLPVPGALHTYLHWRYRNDVTISRDFLLTQQVSVNDDCWSLLDAKRVEGILRVYYRGNVTLKTQKEKLLCTRLHNKWSCEGNKLHHGSIKASIVTYYCSKKFFLRFFKSISPITLFFNLWYCTYII